MSEYIALSLCDGTIVVGKTVHLLPSHELDKITLNPSIVLSGEALGNHKNIIEANISVLFWHDNKTGLESNRTIKDWVFQFECNEKDWEKFFKIYFNTPIAIGRNRGVPSDFTGLYKYIDPDRNFFELYWYVNGKLHKEDGPASIYSNGQQNWVVNSKRHRIGGPACQYLDGHKEWYIDGKCYSENEYWKLVNKLQGLSKH